MTTISPAQKIAAEFIGTSLLLATVVGSGIMGESLAEGNAAVALLANALATGAVLHVLITLFAPVSGAHFNPLVTLAMVCSGKLPKALLVPYFTVQVVGAVAGVLLAHVMFDSAILQVSQKTRWGIGQWVAEATATFGLLMTIIGLLRDQAQRIPQAVALYVVGAYWFTASTSFANPAVTLARSLTNTFAGIEPSSVLPFMLAQAIGGTLAFVVCRRLFST
jgi:glycerol uptake facilitator-like aquaporin